MLIPHCIVDHLLFFFLSFLFCLLYCVSFNLWFRVASLVFPDSFFGGGGFSGWYYVVRVRGTTVPIKKGLEDKKENGDLHKTHIWFPERWVFFFKLWHCSAK